MSDRLVCRGCGEEVPGDQMDDGGHLVERQCGACGGSGSVLYGYVTRDMALDACEPSMEGMPLEGRCPRCYGGVEVELCGPVEAEHG